MIDTKSMWKKRHHQYTVEVRRYLRYMLNDHLLIALIFFTGGAAYYYNRWLEDLPQGVPYLLIIAIILSFFLTKGSVQTLLKEPDLVFLLPVEKRLDSYFNKAFLWSALIQGYLLLIVFAIIAPLYLKLTGQTFLQLSILFGIILLIKIWNLFMAWNIEYLQESWTRLVDPSIRYIINFVLCYFLISQAHIMFILTLLILMGCVLTYFYKLRQSKGLKWDRLIELESKRMLMFYRIANLFTDVPKLKERIKRRAWLGWVTGLLGYSQDHSYKYLYLRTFLRSSDYFGIFVRLTLIGGAALYFVPMNNGKLVLGVLFLYLTGYQLMTLWRHHHMKIWLNLYPVRFMQRQASFLSLINAILIVQTFFFVLFLIGRGDWLLAVSLFILGVIFNYVFVYHYVRARLSKIL